MAGKFDANYYDAVKWSDKFKSFKVTIAASANQWKTIWTPASGKKFRLKGGIINAMVSTLLGSGTAGDPICLFEGAASSIPIVPFGAIVATNDAAGTRYATGFSFDLKEGYLASAADAVLTVGTNTAMTGSSAILAMGIVWGTEE